MIRRYKISWVLFLSLVFYHSNANEPVSSLLEALDKSSSNQKIELLEKLAKHYANVNHDSAIYFSELGIELAKKQDDIAGVADFYHYIGIAKYRSAKYSEAIEYFNQAVTLRKKIGEVEKLADSYNNLALIYNIKGEYEHAVKYNFMALKIREEINNREAIAKSFNNIGTTYHYMGKLDLASHYYKEALVIKTELGDERGQASSLNNIGLIYLEKKDHHSIDSAIIYFQSSLSICKKYDKYYGMSEALLNLGNAKAMKKDYKSAEQHYNQAMQVNKTHDNGSMKALLTYNIATMKYKRGKDKEALDLMYNGLKIAQEVKNTDLVKDIYYSLSEIHAGFHDYLKAFEYSQKYIKLKDSLLNEKISKQVAEIRGKYDAERKEKLILKNENQVKELEIKKKQVTIIFISIIGFLLLVYGVYLLIAFYKKKILLQTVQTQKNEISKKNVEITESILYAKSIQDALLPKINNFTGLFPESFVIYHPRDIVSGDYLWFTMEGNTKMVALIDCTGHGVPGAFITLISNEILNNLVLEKNIKEPSLILNELNDEIQKVLQDKVKNGEPLDGMDMAFCAINDEELIYSGAHMSVALYKNNQLNILKGNKYSIGELPGNTGAKFEDYKENIEKGNILYLFSDGYQDQMGGINNNPIKMQNFYDLLREINHLPMKEQKEFLENYLEKWKKDNPQTDDILVAAIKF